MSIKPETEDCSEVLCLVVVNNSVLFQFRLSSIEESGFFFVGRRRGWLIASVRLEIVVGISSPVSFFDFIRERLNWPAFYHDFLFILPSSKRRRNERTFSIQKIDHFDVVQNRINFSALGVV